MRFADVGMRRVAIALVIAVTVHGPASGSDRIFAVHISQGSTARLVRNALEGAARRMEQPGCESLVDLFTDADGRPLRASLDKAGVGGADYLSLLVFYDGSRHPRCHAEGSLAVAQAGSRIVWICPEPFRRLAWRDPGIAEAVLIHEALHSLGLGENPPSGNEITARVLSTCFR